MRGTSARSAEPQRPAQKPNPALHLTPPSDWGRTAHPMVAVQVSCSFGNPEGHERAFGGAGRVVREGDARASGFAWCRSGWARLTVASLRLGVASDVSGHGGSSG
ncbi:hypothetical protein R5W24_006525 [Gemmata sp. JC717]|uniref:hypothetical protein n=1 Tax=Gemmata algarum TaxID=2975278 RepID=UPI0021BAA10C|nr:hypothetical protein [Gemmata algarum]MDY3557337.1 hypothetical protein [Gemmata algarum]